MQNKFNANSWIFEEMRGKKRTSNTSTSNESPYSYDFQPISL